MDILSDVSVKGNLETLGEMKVICGGFSVNKFDARLIICGCSGNNSFKIGAEYAGGGNSYMFICRGNIDFYQYINFYKSVEFYEPINFNATSVFRYATAFCESVGFWKDIRLMNGGGDYISIDNGYDNNIGSYVVIDSSVYTKGSFYKNIGCSSTTPCRIDNKFCLSVPENCTKFHIFKGLTGTEFLPVINSYEAASEGCLKKVDMDIFVTEGSIIGERVSTEQKYYLFSFYLA